MLPKKESLSVSTQVCMSKKISLICIPWYPLKNYKATVHGSPKKHQLQQKAQKLLRSTTDSHSLFVCQERSARSAAFSCLSWSECMLPSSESLYKTVTASNQNGKAWKEALFCIIRLQAFWQNRKYVLYEKNQGLSLNSTLYNQKRLVIRLLLGTAMTCLSCIAFAMLIRIIKIHA